MFGHVWASSLIIIDLSAFDPSQNINQVNPSQVSSQHIPTIGFKQKQATIQPTPTASWLNAKWRGDHPSVGWAHGAPGLLGAPIPKHLADDFSLPDQQIPETWDLEHWNLGSHQTQWDQTHVWWIWICCVMLVPGSCWYRAHYPTNDTNEGVALTDSESDMSNLAIWLRRIGNIQPLRTSFLFVKKSWSMINYVYFDMHLISQTWIWNHICSHPVSRHVCCWKLLCGLRFFPNSWRKLLVGACSAKDMRHISAVLCSKFVTIIQNEVARTYHISTWTGREELQIYQKN